MSGYKRVNFHDLCRLCATNQQQDKVHIFQEEGIKNKLQDKIESMLALKVSEDDDLPKVVCSECLESLERCYKFRSGCISSETMLSSYFKNFRYTDDFTKSGKVYIKDTDKDHLLVKLDLISSTPINKEPTLQPPLEPKPPQKPPNKKIKPQQITINANGEIISIPVINAITDNKKLPTLLPKRTVLEELAAIKEKDSETTAQQIEAIQTCFLQYDGMKSELNTISPNWADIGLNAQIDKMNVRLFECGACKKTFKRREHLYQHEKLHTGYRPFTCDHCNKSFMRKEHLYRHMTSHSGLKNFQCDICTKTFSRNDNLLKHKKTHEKNGIDKDMTCEICCKVFILKHYYLAHKAQHEMEKTNKLRGVRADWGVKA